MRHKVDFRDVRKPKWNEGNQKPYNAYIKTNNI